MLKLMAIVKVWKKFNYVCIDVSSKESTLGDYVLNYGSRVLKYILLN